MVPFQATLKVDDEALIFFFSKIYTLNEQKFSVNVKRGAEYVALEMIRSDSGKWRIADPAPAWARELENALSSIIAQNF